MNNTNHISTSVRSFSGPAWLQPPKPGCRAAVRRPRRAFALPLLISLLVLFIAVATLAVDYGHVQLVKGEMQRTADVTARGLMQYYINTNGNQTSSATSAAALYTTANNPVDGKSGVLPSVAITWGFWTPGTTTFSTVSGTEPAVKVTLTRTSTGGNAVPLFWGGLLNVVSADVHATAIAAEAGGTSAPVTIPSTASIYLAGMPSGTTNSGGDTTANATPYQITSIPVTPGTFITLAGLTGTTTVSPGAIPNTGPAGDSSYPVQCGQSWNNDPNLPGPCNGIANATFYEDAAVGLFLTAAQPSLTAAPATVDWTQGTIGNQAVYTNLAIKAPFLIGTGQTSGKVTKQFMVPPGATRLYLAIWDGYEYYNNTGQLTGTVTQLHYVQLVQ